MKKFTEDEKAIARNIDKRYEWMARDKDGELYVFFDKPFKNESGGFFGGNRMWCDCVSELFDCGLFESVRWEDDEPTRISDIYNPPVLDDVEKKYLKAVLKPFHDKVVYAVKYGHILNDDGTYRKEYLFVRLCDTALEFPDFDSRKMYSGMERNKEYTLDELGITYDD